MYIIISKNEKVKYQCYPAVNDACGLPANTEYHRWILKQRLLVGSDDHLSQRHQMARLA